MHSSGDYDEQRLIDALKSVDKIGDVAGHAHLDSPDDAAQ